MRNAHTRMQAVPKRYEYLCSPSESHAGRSYSDAYLRNVGHNPRCLVLLSLNHIFQSCKSCKIPLKVAELSIMQLVNQRCCSRFAAAVFSDDRSEERRVGTECRCGDGQGVLEGVKELGVESLEDGGDIRE